MAHDYTRFAAPAPHPGEHLREDYMPAYGLTAVFDAFLEPDQDASWSPTAIAERRLIWDETAQMLYGQ